MSWCVLGREFDHEELVERIRTVGATPPVLPRRASSGRRAEPRRDDSAAGRSSSRTRSSRCSPGSRPSPTRVFTRGELLRDIWDWPPHMRTRTLDAHASRLRRKLRAFDPSTPGSTTSGAWATAWSAASPNDTSAVALRARAAGAWCRARRRSRSASRWRRRSGGTGARSGSGCGSSRCRPRGPPSGGRRARPGGRRCPCWPYGTRASSRSTVLVERRDAEVERQVELAAAALEVLVELAAHLVERRAQDAGAEDARDDLVLAFDGVRDAAEAARGRGERTARRRASRRRRSGRRRVPRAARPRGSGRRAQA